MLRLLPSIWNSIKEYAVVFAVSEAGAATVGRVAEYNTWLKENWNYSSMTAFVFILLRVIFHEKEIADQAEEMLSVFEDD
jgi:hypothetical protein